jgi:hypothetical protein
MVSANGMPSAGTGRDAMLEDAPADRLMECANVEALHRYLIIDSARRRTHRAAETAAEVLCHYHGGGQQGVVDTALLLCTDRRWERQTGQVVRQIAACGVLDDGGLDELAERLLWPDRISFVHPWIWFGSYELVVPVRPGRSDKGGRIRVPADTTVPTPRLDTPPLRRWAAARVLDGGPERLDDVLERVASLDVLRAAGVTAGVVDVLERFTAERARQVLELALRHGHKSVRRAAFDRLLARGEHERVWALCREDPDASICSWAERLRESLETETRQATLFPA